MSPGLGPTRHIVMYETDDVCCDKSLQTMKLRDSSTEMSGTRSVADGTETRKQVQAVIRIRQATPSNAKQRHPARQHALSY